MQPEDEAILYQPAGEDVRRTMPPWYGRKANAPPLTAEWLKNQIATGSIVPPQVDVPRSYGYMILAVVVVGCAMVWAAFAMGAWRS